MRWSAVLVVLLLAAACSSSGSPEAAPAEQFVEPTVVQPFELLPPTDGTSAAGRQGTVFIETVLLVEEQQAAVVFAGGPTATSTDDPCAVDYRVDVLESVEQVVLTVHQLPSAAGDAAPACEAAGQQRRLLVPLQSSLGDRLVIDGHDQGERTVHDPAEFLWPSAIASGWSVNYRDVSRLGFVSGYGPEANLDDAIVLLAGPEDAATWSLTEATRDVAAADVVQVDARPASAGPAVLISENPGGATIAFDEQGIHYRVTATGAVTQEMLLAFVGDLAYDAQARGLEIPFAARLPVVVGDAVPTPTVTARDPSIAWSAAASTRDVENFLTALRAGAYEQAAWPAWGNGVLFEGQPPDTTGADYLAQSCAGGLCNGPYIVRGQPGIIDDETMQASAVVVVTHITSGVQVDMAIRTFEGQRIIGNLPPLISDNNDASLLDSLFGGSLPQYSVVERFEAFEISDRGTTSWVTHWDAESATQIEGDIVVGPRGTFLVTDPQNEFDVRCAQLLERAGVVLARDGCVTDRWAIENVATGEVADAPAAFPTVGEAESAWLAERGGTVLVGLRDAEGNLESLVSSEGVDLLDGDYAGTAVLAVDGAHLAYVDHGDPAAISHFWSPVVVVREIASGTEVGRWTLNGAALCLQFAEEWIVACEADNATLAFSDPDQRSLVAINISTGEINVVPTATKLFLPTPVAP